MGYAPLIAHHINGKLSVRDGNHRLGAMELDKFEIAGNRLG